MARADHPTFFSQSVPQTFLCSSEIERIIYIVSGVLDYSLLICPDAGPAYAQSFGWRYDTVDKIRSYLNDQFVLFIDTRLNEEEYENLYECISANPDTEFVLTVTDPCFEQCIDKPLYKLLFRCVEMKNVRFLSRYQPTELIEFLYNLVGENRLLTLNFPYVLHREIESNKKRKHRIVLSGALGKTMYPERYQFWRIVTRSVWRLKVDVLSHPGYPDVGMTLSHQIFDDSYIQYLAKYSFMFIGPSRCDLELLKYTECAYAGCVPVGKSPKTFDSNLDKYVQKIDFHHISRSLLRIFSIPNSELQDIAKCYREEIKKQRMPEQLNQKAAEFLRNK
jgi:hypothetical protein